jgi:ArsR family transcriptional regulator, arsenate/arsenite/antimonite-responsive transcriptional repressor
MSSKGEITTVEFARAVGDPTRLQIMEFCCCEWRSVSEITSKTYVSQPTVSHHLALLRDADLVEIRHEGKQTYYRLKRSRVETCCGMVKNILMPESK